MDDMLLLATTSSQESTMVLKGLLDAEGIKFLLQRGNTGALTNFTGSFGGAAFFVKESQLEKAKQVLDRFEKAQPLQKQAASKRPLSPVFIILVFGGILALMAAAAFWVYSSYEEADRTSAYPSYLLASSSVPVSVPGNTTEAPLAFRFEDYSAGSIATGTPAAPDFSTMPEALAYRTKIAQGAAAGPNFAGHYTVVTFGCGTSCQGNVLLDSRTGKILSLPEGTVSPGDALPFTMVTARGIRYRSDSGLLVADPPAGVDEEVVPESFYFQIPVRYYVLEGDTLRLLKETPCRVERVADIWRQRCE